MCMDSFCHLISPPRLCKETGLTGEATFNGTASVGFSFVNLLTTVSTAGLHVRPPLIPFSALVRNFHSLAVQLYFSAVFSKSFNDTSSHRQTIISSTDIPP